jgi:para-nitrobenzyl esterase
METLPARRLVAIAALVAALVLLAGCTLPAPPGAAPLRYRDVVFPSVGVTRDLTYGSARGADGSPVSLKLDLYQPSGDTVAQRPAVVYVHGGGFCCGDKSGGATFANYFTQRGYVAVSINYRLLVSEGCGGQPNPSQECIDAALAAQHDAQAAVRWLRANASTYRIDPNRIAIAGSSAGAVTSLLVDWRKEDPGTSGNPGYSSTVRAAVSISGGAPTNEWITADDGPAIFFHGTVDRTVPYNWAVQNAGAMYNLHIPVVFEPFEGAGHGLDQAGFGNVIRQQSSYFLYATLDLGHAPGQSAAAARASTRYRAGLLREYRNYRLPEGRATPAPAAP